MPSRTLSSVLGALLVTGGLTALIAAPASAVPADPSARLFLHGTSATYAEDSLKDPFAWEGYAPTGVTTDTKPPTGTTTKTGLTFEPGGDPGLPMAPTFLLGQTGKLTSACLDVFVEARNPGAEFPIGVGFGAGPPFLGAFTYPEPPSGAGTGIVRVTTMLKIDPAFDLADDTTIFFYLSGFSAVPPDSTTRPYTLHYDSVAHPSNVTLNATSCTPFAGSGPAPAPSGSAAPPSESASPSAEPTSAEPTPSAEPSPSAEPTAEPTEPSPEPPPSTSCAPSSGEPSASGEPTADPSATGDASPSAEPSAAATSAAAAAPAALPPSIPPGGSSSPTPAPSASESPSEEPSASESPSAGAGGACDPETVTLRANFTSITAGNAPQLSGVVRNARGDAIHGTTVTIYSKGYGESSYTAAATVRTDEAGQFRIHVRPLKLTAFVAGAAAKRAPAVAIRVATRMEITSPRPDAAVANPVTFTGRLTPGYARVAVGLGYLSRGRFIVLTQANTNGSGSYAVTARLPRGTYPFVVFTSAHQGTDKGSRSVRLTVR